MSRLTERFITYLSEETGIPNAAFNYFRLHDATDEQRANISQASDFAVAVTLENLAPQRVAGNRGAGTMIADLIIDLLVFNDRPADLVNMSNNIFKAMYDLSTRLPDYEDFKLLTIEERGQLPRYNQNSRPTTTLTYGLEMPLTFDA